MFTGGRSSTAERQPVELNVAGSNPVAHPHEKTDLQRVGFFCE